MSAESPSIAFDLRCLVREKTIKFLQGNYRQCLPTRLNALTLNAATSAKGESIEALRNTPHRTL
jgi:hypothetical protein